MVSDLKKKKLTLNYNNLIIFGMTTAVDGKLLLSEHVAFVRKIRCHYRNGMFTKIMYFNAQKAI